LLSDAKAGDLANHGEVIEASAVARWLLAHLSPSLQQLLQETLQGADGGGDQIYDDLLELVQQRRVIPLTQAAQHLEHELSDVERCVRRHSDQFGLLTGPPAVVFELVPETGALGA
jgi:hypothetical protein